MLKRQADAYSGDLILPPFMVGPKVDRLGEISLDGIAAPGIEFQGEHHRHRNPRYEDDETTAHSRAHIICSAAPGSGRPSPQDEWSIRDDLDRGRRHSLPWPAAARRPPGVEPANYWFDRRHVEQFDLRVQSFRTIEGEVLTLIRLLDPRMIEIYG